MPDWAVVAELTNMEQNVGPEFAGWFCGPPRCVQDNNDLVRVLAGLERSLEGFPPQGGDDDREFQNTTPTPANGFAM